MLLLMLLEGLLKVLLVLLQLLLLLLTGENVRVADSCCMLSVITNSNSLC